jgi:hypothetical protein
MRSYFSKNLVKLLEIPLFFLLVLASSQLFGSRCIRSRGAWTICIIAKVGSTHRLKRCSWSGGFGWGSAWLATLRSSSFSLFGKQFLLFALFLLLPQQFLFFLSAFFLLSDFYHLWIIIFIGPQRFQRSLKKLGLAQDPKFLNILRLLLDNGLNFF